MSEPSLLDRILEPDGLRVRFQPVFGLHRGAWHVEGLEALMRGPRGTNMESAEVLFEYVRRKREESLVDRECVLRALREAARLPGTPRIAVNVHASTLGRDRDFLGFVAETATANGVAHDRLTVEIVEHAPCWEGPSILRALEGLRHFGVRIALDDIGLGQSNYRMILECRPDYFKIDRYLVRGAGEDPHRQAVLRSIASLAASFGARTVAEGVDNVVDLDTVVALQLDAVQGFLFAAALSVEQLRSSGLLDGVPLAVPIIARSVTAGVAGAA